MKVNLYPKTGQDKYKPSENMLRAPAQDILSYIVKGVFTNK